jgi:DNA-binding PadR family transcriptional regulator
VPRNNNFSYDAKLEVRSFSALKEIKFLTKRFNEEYQDKIYELTDSDRNNIEELPEIVEEAKTIKEPQANLSDFETLGIWETKQRFIEALGSVKEKILIESPWIKQATREYVPYFEEFLKQGKRLIILYGMEDKDEHDYTILKRLEELQRKYNKYFNLIHLPTHFRNVNLKLKGTHRKLMIKDNEYYISGSFNFLSFGKQENQKVSNEESHLIRKKVKEKWESIIKEYSINVIGF